MLTALFFVAAISFTSCGKDNQPDDPIPPVQQSKPTKEIYDHTNTTTWSKDTIYIIDGFVFVEDGDSLTIEAGTVVKAKPGQGVNASALIVARGGYIDAQGTASEPIIFTAITDDLNGSVPTLARGLWGGIIILGNAVLNSTPGETNIEGIPTTEVRGLYGGNDDTDNSGIIKYVSIRHGGTDIGSGNEINGLTLGGVGSGTTINYVEIIANQDDGIEFFGGKPRIKHALVAFCGDDAFDYDEGFRGFGQFWVTIQDESEGDRCGEHDGGTSPEDGTPYATPTIYNATYVGRGTGNGKRVITFRDNAGGTYNNCIFVNQEKGIDVELLASGEHSWERFKAGDLELNNNIFYNVADGTASGIFNVSYGSGASSNPDSTNAASTFAAYFTSAGNTVSNPGIVSTFGSFNLIPTSAGAAYTGTISTPTDPWFDVVNYKGAFDQTNWAAGWTLAHSSGLLQ